MQRGGNIGEFVDRFVFSAQLNQIDTAFDHFLRDPIAITDRHITKINNAVEMAIV